MSTPFEIKLKSIKVIENGTLEQEKGLNAVIATLHYPSPGKVGVITTRKCQLEDKVTRNKVFSFTGISSIFLPIV